ncbi:MAG: hypothetical protein Q4C41_00285 [Eggerthellaceae bacterium]|nr:hypothetical protein [Eggerthellaceae bacterium]
MDARVMSLVEGALEGRTIAPDDALFLLGFAADSAEAAHVCWAADALARRASHNTAQIYAQIGLDATPCPENCAFCALAARNAAQRGHERGRAEVPDSEVVDYARVFDEAGVHLVSLMATAAYDFEHFLDVARKVRAAVAPDLVIMANIGDIDAAQACALADAGVQMAYHANRIGEGVITDIAPERRLRTLAAIKEAGLAVMSGVEPVHAGTNPRDVVSKMYEVIALEPYCAGVVALTAVEGTDMGDCTPISRKRALFMASIMRLAAGTSIPFGTGGRNAVWTDSGTNPRGRNLSTNPDFLRRDVARLRKELRGQEWHVPERGRTDNGQSSHEAQANA